MDHNSALEIQEKKSYTYGKVCAEIGLSVIFLFVASQHDVAQYLLPLFCQRFALLVGSSWFSFYRTHRISPWSCTYFSDLKK